jgi:hypothetical protein
MARLQQLSVCVDVSQQLKQRVDLSCPNYSDFSEMPDSIRIGSNQCCYTFV